VLSFFGAKRTKNSRISAGKKRNSHTRAHDVALISRLRKRAFPTPSQLFQIGRVLSPREHTYFVSACIVFVLSLGVVGAVIADSYRVAVPKVAGTYHEGMIGSPQSLNPLFSSLNEVDQDIVSLVYSGLLRFDAQRRLVPDLAVKYEISEDKKTYIFELKQNVLWHDGTPFTASDVVYTFESIQDMDVGSPLYVSFQNIQIQALDEYTVSFTLSEPFTPFLTSLTVGIIPRHIWGTLPSGQIRLAQRNLQPVGTGPFRFRRLIKNEMGFVQRVELTRFEDFYRNPPYLREVIFEFFSEYDGPQGLISALREQKVSGMSFVPFEYRERVRRRHITLHTLQLPQYAALFFNLNNEILKNTPVRQALARAVDKRRIVSDVLDNEAQIIDGPILPRFPGYGMSESSYVFAIEEANTALDALYDRVSATEYRAILLEERVSARVAIEQSTLDAATSTLTDPLTESEHDVEIDMSDEGESEDVSAPTPATSDVDIDSIREQVNYELDLLLDPAQLFYRYPKNGSKKDILNFELVTAATPEYAKVAEIIAGSFQEIGIKVTVRLVDTRDITREVLRSRGYDMLLYGVIVGNDPDQYPFWHSSQMSYPGLNLSSYSNRDMDQLLDTIRTTEDDEVLVEAYAAFEQKVIDDVPAVFLYTPTYTYALTDNVKGFAVDQIARPSDRFANITEWYTHKKKVWRDR